MFLVGAGERRKEEIARPVGVVVVNDEVGRHRLLRPIAVKTVRLASRRRAFANSSMVIKRQRGHCRLPHYVDIHEHGAGDRWAIAHAAVEENELLIKGRLELCELHKATASFTPLTR